MRQMMKILDDIDMIPDKKNLYVLYIAGGYRAYEHPKPYADCIICFRNLIDAQKWCDTNNYNLVFKENFDE